MIKWILLAIAAAALGVWAFNAHAQRKQSFYGIWYIVGPVGSGKSTYMAKMSRRWLKNGGKVYSNFPLNGCYKISVNDLSHYTPTPYSLILIDESGIELNSRNYKNTEKSLIEFMKLSRHYKCRVVFASQTFTDTDKQIRELATRVLFLKPVVVGEVTAVKDVVSKLAIDSEGQPSVQFEIKRFGGAYALRPYRKYFDSFSCPDRVELVSELWP